MYFLDLPSIPKTETYMPTAEELAQAIKIASKNKTLQAMIVFAAGTGMRIGEILATRIGADDGRHTTWDPSNSTVYVRTSMFRNKEQAPKTDAAIRDVHICSNLNEFLIQYAGTRDGLLFPNKVGRILHDSSAHAQLDKVGILGFHGLRRWRVTSLRKSVFVPQDLINFWIGHSENSMSALYSKVSQDLELRKQCAEKVGTGFEIPWKVKA